MTPYVMFGFGPLFGDYADTVHALGGRLRCVVQNIPDPAHESGRSFASRLGDFNTYCTERGIQEPAELVQLEGFQPEGGDRCFLGFRGAQQRPLVELMGERFGIVPTPLVHPSAVVSPTATVGQGAFIGAGCVVASEVRVGEHVLVNRSASIGHECCLGPYCNIGPGSRLAASITVGTGAALGVGVTIIPFVTVGSGAYVAAGAVVTRDVAPGTLVAGVPAAFKKRLS